MIIVFSATRRDAYGCAMQMLSGDVARSAAIVLPGVGVEKHNRRAQSPELPHKCRRHRRRRIATTAGEVIATGNSTSGLVAGHQDI